MTELTRPPPIIQIMRNFFKVSPPTDHRKEEDKKNKAAIVTAPDQTMTNVSRKTTEKTSLTFQLDQQGTQTIISAQ